MKFQVGDVVLGLLSNRLRLVTGHSHINNYVKLVNGEDYWTIIGYPQNYELFIPSTEFNSEEEALDTIRVFNKLAK